MSSTTRCLSSVTTRVPELRPFTVRGPQPADFFPPIEADPDGEINMPIGNLPLLIDFHHQRVQIEDRRELFPRTLLPGSDFLHHPVGHRRDQLG